MKTTKFFNDVQRKWVVIDAQGQVLGRLAVHIARILQGKNKATYTPNFLCGDKVIVINARHIKLSGTKELKKIYDMYSGYPSGRKETTLQQLQEKNPAKVLFYAVKGMVPKNWLGKQMLRSLRIYMDQEHDQQAQKPETVQI